MRKTEHDKSKWFDLDKKKRASAFGVADLRGPHGLAGSRACSGPHLTGGEGRNPGPCSRLLSTATAKDAPFYETFTQNSSQDLQKSSIEISLLKF